MSALVTFRSGHRFEFHVGSRPGERLAPGNWLDIVSLYCDGHELDQAEEIIGRTVPKNRRYFVFVGDEAKTIFLNFQ